MKILFQWALKNPQDWQEIDARDFATLPKKPIPTTIGGQNNQLGLLADLMVQGVRFNGMDHIAVEPITIGNDEGVKVTGWNDDPVDWPVGQRVARIWTFLPLSPDAKLGGAINTVQFQTVYAEGQLYTDLIANIPQNTTVRPFSEFIAPAESITRHGTWLTDAKWQEHLTTRTPDWGWMHWNEHLSDSECEIDKLGRRILKEQRKQGRYRQAEHTITYYTRDTDSAVGWSSYSTTQEDAMELTTGNAATETLTVGSGSGAWVFTTPISQPNNSDWPSGVFHHQINCTAASANIAYGDNNGFNAYFGFHRISSDTNTDIDRAESAGANKEFTGTGLKLMTSVTWDSAAGNATDRYSVFFFVTGASHGDAMTIQLNTSDSYADGPWPGAATRRRNFPLWI